jgi:1-deoxy-D-xylulose-5-phosphate synthase
VLNARFVKPLDVDRIVALAKRCRALVTVEEASGPGGFGAAVLEALAEADVQVPCRCIAIPDRVVEHGDSGAIRASLGLDAAGIVRAVSALLAEHPSR